MNEVNQVLELVESYELSYNEALDVILESDLEKAAKKMAAKIKDPEKRKKAEEKFLKNMKKFKGKSEEMKRKKKKDKKDTC